jgi:hypothetical protein
MAAYRCIIHYLIEKGGFRSGLSSSHHSKGEGVASEVISVAEERRAGATRLREPAVLAVGGVGGHSGGT